MVQGPAVYKETSKWGFKSNWKQVSQFQLTSPVNETNIFIKSLCLLPYSIERLSLPSKLISLDNWNLTLLGAFFHNIPSKAAKQLPNELQIIKKIDCFPAKESNTEKKNKQPFYGSILEQDRSHSNAPQKRHRR